MMNYIIIMNITTMATYVNLQFNDGEIKLSTSSFLFKYSKLLQLIDIEEDNNIPLLCSKTYVTENNAYLFDDKPDLSFMFTLQPNKFLDVCKFLDIICYENEDTLVSTGLKKLRGLDVRTQFIEYVMTNIKEEINVINYFMQPEIRSIMNYLNEENADIQIKSCTLEFYELYLTEYKEEVIKHNRIDIYESAQNKDEYYRYIHKYDNQLSYDIDQTYEYSRYYIRINEDLITACNIPNNVSNIKNLIEQGADVNFQYLYGYSVLQLSTNTRNNLENIQYLVEQGANINLQNESGDSALHGAVMSNNLEAVKNLVSLGIDINLKNNSGNTALQDAFRKDVEVINYLKNITQK